MAVPKKPALTHRIRAPGIRPPGVSRATGHATASDQVIVVHDFGFRPIHRAPLKFALIANSIDAGCRQPIRTEIPGLVRQRG